MMQVYLIKEGRMGVLKNKDDDVGLPKKGRKEGRMGILKNVDDYDRRDDDDTRNQSTGQDNTSYNKIRANI